MKPASGGPVRAAMPPFRSTSPKAEFNKSSFKILIIRGVSQATQIPERNANSDVNRINIQYILLVVRRTA